MHTLRKTPGRVTEKLVAILPTSQKRDVGHPHPAERTEDNSKDRSQCGGLSTPPQTMKLSAAPVEMTCCLLQGLLRGVGEVAADDLFGFDEDLVEGEVGGVEEDRVGGRFEGRFGAVAVTLIALAHLGNKGGFGDCWGVGRAGQLLVAAVPADLERF